jgi:hypothetical protein
MTATTAQLRRQAAECEQRLEWGRAADFWQAAIDNYPRPQGRPLGALAEADLAAMHRRMTAALGQYFPA